jgi:heme-degrading monooxygenase HmoA
MKIDRRYVLKAGSAFVPVLSLGAAFGSQGDPKSQSAGQTKLVDMDPNVSFTEQIERNVAPVVLLSTFLVKSEYINDFLNGFQKQFAIMRRQPGLISAQLHRGIGGSCLFMNYVIWESTDAFKRGFELPEFQLQLKQYPPGTEVSAFMFQRIAVPGMCLGEPAPSK